MSALGGMPQREYSAMGLSANDYRPTCVGQESDVMRAIILASVIALLSVTTATAQQSVTNQTTFYPLHMDGQLSGCQVGFSVVREDVEFSGGAPMIVNGLLVFYGPANEAPGVMLRLGISPANAQRSFSPPARAFLVAGMQTNVRDAGESYASDMPGFRAFPFGLGDATAEAIGRSLVSNQLQIAYGLAGTRIDARFVVDLAASSNTAEQWFECIDTVIGRS